MGGTHTHTHTSDIRRRSLCKQLVTCVPMALRYRGRMHGGLFCSARAYEQWLLNHLIAQRESSSTLFGLAVSELVRYCSYVLTRSHCCGGGCSGDSGQACAIAARFHFGRSNGSGLLCNNSRGGHRHVSDKQGVGTGQQDVISHDVPAPLTQGSHHATTRLRPNYHQASAKFQVHPPPQ